MGLFGKKKKKKEDASDESGDDAGADAEVPVAEPQSAPSGTGDVSLGKVVADVEKLKAQFTTFYELQKTNSERFAMINQQIGEIRSMQMERDKSAQLLEAKATQAIDLVKTVQPDKLLIELRKGDNKIEALRANIESNENIINNIISELKEVKNTISVFRGMEQVIKLNEESKQELREMKRVSAVIERHSDKIETIFSEIQKKMADFVKVGDLVKDLDKSFKQISSDFDSIKIKTKDYATRKELENLIVKMDDFEKYVGNVVKLVDANFNKQHKEFGDFFKKNMEDVSRLLDGFKVLAAKTPDLDKYFHLIESQSAAKPAASPQAGAGGTGGAHPEKLKELGGDDERLKVQNTGGLLGGFTALADKFKKK